MAKWGEGDPRWLVEERPDATNVNNWHWTEKNASQWSKTKFPEVFIGTKVTTDFGECEITEMTKCEGDAVVNNRKAKLIFFYEWAMEMKWTGSLVHGDTTVNGTIEIPNFSEEHDLKDIDIYIHLESVGPEAEVLKDMMKTTGAEVIRSCLSVYLQGLKKEFSKGLILPTKEISPTLQVVNEKLNERNDTKIKSIQSPIETSDFQTSEIFKCTADEFYRALTIKELVEAFTQGPCVLEPENGGKFELFDGNVQGRFINLVPNKTIQKTWRFSTWPESHFSEVTIGITQLSDCTEVNITQTGIPASELQNTRDGWKRFYWDSMRRAFGFGALLF